MKKIFTLLAAAVVAVPMMTAANELTVDADVYYKLDYTNFSKVASLKQKMAYDETKGIYTFVDFLGWNGANLEFKISEGTKTVESLKGTDQATQHAVLVNFSTVNYNDAVANNDMILPNNTTSYSKEGTQFCVNSSDYSGTFVGDPNDYRFAGKMYFECNYEGSLSYNSQIKSYAIVADDNIEVVIMGAGMGNSIFRTATGTDSWSAVGIFGMYSCIKFNFPAELKAGVEGIEIDNNDAPVEYFNLQGVKVENPAAGLYIKRQGDKVEKVVIR